ncbi:MAG TPA: GldM family protein [Bacteroidales bacterium]
MRTIVLMINLLWWINLLTQAQCDKTLVQKATEQAGKDVVLVRDFKVKLKEGDKRNPAPVSRFSVLMQDGVTYRFNVIGASENAEPAILQLYDKSDLLGSTFDFDKGLNVTNFQYPCIRTGNYQVILSFRNNKAGCAAGIMTMVLDSAFMASRNQSEIPEEDVLYLGIENQLMISTDSVGSDRFEVSVDNGTVTEAQGHYVVKVQRPGSVKVLVKQIAANGKVMEETEKDFKAIPLPEPKIKLERTRDEYVNSFDFSTIYKLEVVPSVYRIMEYYVSDSRTPFSGFRSTDEFLTVEQKDFLKNLRSGQHFYIHDIKVECPDGRTITTNPIEYFVR